MNTWIALCKREWLEHKGGFAWAPLGLLGALIVLTLLVLTLGEASRFKIDLSSVDESEGISHHTHVDTGPKSVREALTAVLEQESWDTPKLERALANVRLGVMVPFALVYFLVAFFVLLGSLHDDRRDRSVLFWKALPVSDAQTVLSKLATVVWLAPLVLIATVVVAQLFFITVLSTLAANSDHLSAGAIWAHSGLGLGFLELLVGYFTPSFWALPRWGWLLLVSSVAPRVPFVWAVLVPAVPMLAEWVLFGTGTLRGAIGNHLSGRAMPSVGNVESTNIGGIGEMVTPPVGLPEILSLWATTDMWLGIVVGGAFIYGAIYFRRHNNEL